MLERLKNLREDSDLTQTAIAKLLNVSQRAYSHYEKGDREIPINCLIELAKIYETSIDYLVGLTDVMRPYPRRMEKNKK